MSDTKELIDYLQALAQLKQSGYIVNDEIKEALMAVRKRFNFKEELKEEKKWQFANTFLNYTPHADALYEAIAGNSNKIQKLPFGIDNRTLVFEDILGVLRLFPYVHFITNESIPNVDRVYNYFDKTFDYHQFGREDILILDSGIPYDENALARFILLA